MILSSYRHCNDRKETYRWLNRIAHKIIEQAEVNANGWQDTAFCPLCNQGSQSYYSDGFTVPEGLRRHLVGFGNTHQCFFTSTAMKLARPYWNEQFEAQETLQREQEEQTKSHRRQSETLYQTSPFEEAKLNVPIYQQNVRKPPVASFK